MTNEEKILEMLGNLSCKMDAMQEQTNTRFNAIERRLDSMEHRLDSMEQRMDKMQGQIDGLQIQVTKNRKEMHERFDKLEPLAKYVWEEIDLVDRRASKNLAIHESGFHGIPLPAQFAE